MYYNVSNHSLTNLKNSSAKIKELEFAKNNVQDLELKFSRNALDITAPSAISFGLWDKIDGTLLTLSNDYDYTSKVLTIDLRTAEIATYLGSKLNKSAIGEFRFEGLGNEIVTYPVTVRLNNSILNGSENPPSIEEIRYPTITEIRSLTADIDYGLADRLDIAEQTLTTIGDDLDYIFNDLSGIHTDILNIGEFATNTANDLTLTANELTNQIEAVQTNLDLYAQDVNGTISNILNWQNDANIPTILLNISDLSTTATNTETNFNNLSVDYDLFKTGTNTSLDALVNDYVSKSQIGNAPYQIPVYDADYNLYALGGYYAGNVDNNQYAAFTNNYIVTQNGGMYFPSVMSGYFARTASTDGQLHVADVSGLGTMATQNANNVVISGGNATLSNITINSPSLTASSPISLNQTWNNGAITFSGMKLNVTDLSSNASSLLMDLQVGGVSKFKVDRQGVLYTNGGSIVLINDVWINREGPHILSLARGTNPQEFRLYGTFFNGTNYERMFSKYNATSTSFQIGTEKGSGGGSARNLDFVIDGTARWSINTNGHLYPTSGNDVTNLGIVDTNRINSITVKTIYLGSSNTTISTASNGVVTLLNGAQTDFNRLQFGGTTSSFPALKRNATTLEVRLADDSAYTDLNVNNLIVGTGASIKPVAGGNLDFYCNNTQSARLTNSTFTLYQSGGLILNHASNMIKFSGSDLGLYRNAANTLEINNGTAGTFADLKVKDVIHKPSASLTPANNGEMVFEATSNTSVTVKLKGSDGVVRSAVLTLA